MFSPPQAERMPRTAEAVFLRATDYHRPENRFLARVATSAVLGAN